MNKYYWTCKAALILITGGAKLAFDTLSFVWETEKKNETVE